MDAINETLRTDLLKPEFSEGYAESFQDAYVAAQIKVLREQNGWTQADLARELSTTQTAISRIEDVNYSAWNIKTLKKLARAFRVRLKVSFETYGSLIHDFDGLNRESLKRAPREKDPELIGELAVRSRRRRGSRRNRVHTSYFRSKRSQSSAVQRKPPQREYEPFPTPLNQTSGGFNNYRGLPYFPPNGNDWNGVGVTGR
jgi:transcriptional regulator with XRE-family HTH domain